jgi:glyoxylase-like metal-dependent hydrolase (beta-lactamase superfamily II)
LHTPVPERAFARNELVLHSLSLGAFETNCYLLARTEERDCLVVDPGLDPEPLLDLLADEGLCPAGILLTHAHLDHIGGCRALVERWPVPLLVHPRRPADVPAPGTDRGGVRFPGPGSAGADRGVAWRASGCPSAVRACP